MEQGYNKNIEFCSRNYGEQPFKLIIYLSYPAFSLDTAYFIDI
jgi:hypothetical protein